MNRTAAEKIDSGKTMAEMWEGFAATVEPAAALGSIAYRERQLAFYAGALCLFNWFMVQLDEGGDITEGDLGRVSAIEAEINAFFTFQPVGERGNA